MRLAIKPKCLSNGCRLKILCCGRVNEGLESTQSFKLNNRLDNIQPASYSRGAYILKQKVRGSEDDSGEQRLKIIRPQTFYSPFRSNEIQH